VGTYAGNRPLWLHATGIAEAWLDNAARIVDDAIPGQWDGLPLRELLRTTVEVDVPAPDDQLIAPHAEPERLAKMHVNPTDRARVADLGGADSYATPPYDYAHSDRDQIASVIQRLRFVQNATITTL
jgi:anti-sigma factor RsiW